MTYLIGVGAWVVLCLIGLAFIYGATRDGSHNNENKSKEESNDK